MPRVNREQFVSEFRNLMRRFGRVTTKRIARVRGISESSARTHLKALVKKGKIVRLGRGRATVFSYP